MKQWRAELGERERPARAGARRPSVRSEERRRALHTHTQLARRVFPDRLAAVARAASHHTHGELSRP